MIYVSATLIGAALMNALFSIDYANKQDTAGVTFFATLAGLCLAIGLALLMEGLGQ